MTPDKIETLAADLSAQVEKLIEMIKHLEDSIEHLEDSIREIYLL